MKRAPIATLAAVVALTVGLAACQQTSQTVAPEPAPQVSEFDQGQTPQEPPPAPKPKRIELGTIYFDFDKADIREDARPVLRKNAEILRATGATVVLEGHCDERGDEEYNMALGWRRANAAKRYLVNLGVPESQIKTISYGESRPAVMGHNEEAWQWNRRVEFRVEQ